MQPPSPEGSPLRIFRIQHVTSELIERMIRGWVTSQAWRLLALLSQRRLPSWASASPRSRVGLWPPPRTAQNWQSALDGPRHWPCVVPVEWEHCPCFGSLSACANDVREAWTASGAPSVSHRWSELVGGSVTRAPQLENQNALLTSKNCSAFPSISRTEKSSMPPGCERNGPSGWTTPCL